MLGHAEWPVPWPLGLEALTARPAYLLPQSWPVITTVEFVYHLFCVGMLIAALHIADVRPWAERMALIGWPILIGVSVWFIGGYLPMRRDWSE